MERPDLPTLARYAEDAADAARSAILPHFRARGLEVERKDDGSPVTRADREAETAVRQVLARAAPGIPVLGEEFGDGGEGEPGATDEALRGLRWIVDPVDGTLAFSRGLPTFGTLIALLDEDHEPVVGLIDLPAVGERLVGWKGGGVRDQDGVEVHASTRFDLGDAVVAHGDVYTFGLFGRPDVFPALASEIRYLRGYTDAFGHAQTVRGAVDLMVDLDLAPWDLAATVLLAREAGGACEVFRRRPADVGPDADAARDRGLVFGAPALVEQVHGRFFTDHPSVR